MGRGEPGKGPDRKGKGMLLLTMKWELPCFEGYMKGSCEISVFSLYQYVNELGTQFTGLVLSSPCF